MAEPTEANIVLRWLEECGRIDPIYPTGLGTAYNGPDWRRPRTRSTWGVTVNLDGHLIYKTSSRAIGTELGRFVGERRLRHQGGGGLLLNGDGFEAPIMQAIQTRLRDRARRMFAIRGVMIIPYMALTGAELVYDSILPIHVSGDTFVQNWISVSVPPAKERPYINTTINGSRIDFEWGDREWRLIYNWGSTTLSVMHQPLNGARSFHIVQSRPGIGRGINERIHNLGSAVFTAIGPDGDRHRYLSAFDTQERTPMYFLAQLPDEGKCESYTDALQLLAPPIVHQARKEGRHVYRQGDIFAVETDLDHHDLKHPKVVRRDAVMHGHRMIVHRRNKLRTRLMIYGTGHTATLVAVKENGATFIKGTMHHDPVLERAGREREHTDVRLEPNHKWFLAVRNAVPRATPKREEEDGNSREGS